MYKIMTKIRDKTIKDKALWSVYEEENNNGEVVQLELESIEDVEQKVKDLINKQGIVPSNILVYNPNAINITVDVNEIEA